MISFKRLSVIILLIGYFNACKQYDIDLDTIHNTHRIKMITEYDNSGDEVARDLFTYKDERLVLWQRLSKNENGEMKENWEINVKYNNGNIIASLFNNRNGELSPQQECNYTLFNDLVLEKIVSRLAPPQCNECWKYNYIYQGSRLIEWNKFIKTETNEWKKIRQDQYSYNNNKLIEYKDFVDFDDTGLRLDYKKTYSYKNNRISGWFGGICIAGSEWSPTQKVEYAYDQNNVSTKTYLIWDDTDKSWKYFGALNYYYDAYNNLIEEASSSGTTKIYQYENGRGNSSLFYCDPGDQPEAEPILKSSSIVHSQVPLDLEVRDLIGRRVRF